MRIVRVHQGDVVENVFIIGIHTAQTVLYDEGDFALESRVIRYAVQNQVGLDVAVAVFVLQAFAVQRRTASSTAQQEARACISPAALAKSPTRWKPNIE